MQNNNGDDARGQATLDREERKFERQKAKASSLEANMREQIAAFMADENTKKSIAKDAMAATKDPNRKATRVDSAVEMTLTRSSLVEKTGRGSGSVGFWPSYSEKRALSKKIKELESANAKLQSDLKRTREILDKIVMALVDDED